MDSPYGRRWKLKYRRQLSASAISYQLCSPKPDSPKPEMLPEFESLLEAYPVKLSNFEGPLDLLLHLIKKNEVSIYDIPVARITQQYLEYLELMRELDLDVAGEFLIMAATLIHIKSRMLLPRPAPEQEDADEDPRDALVQRLIEHQKFKFAAELLHEKETVRSAQWSRPDERVANLAGDDYEPELEVDLFSLLAAFRAVVERVRNRPSVLVPGEQISIETRIEQLLARLSETEACSFDQSVRRRASTRADLDRDVPCAAGDDPAAASCACSSSGPSVTSASTSVCVRPTRPRPIGDHLEGADPSPGARRCSPCPTCRSQRDRPPAAAGSSPWPAGCRRTLDRACASAPRDPAASCRSSRRPSRADRLGGAQSRSSRP